MPTVFHEIIWIYRLWLLAAAFLIQDLVAQKKVFQIEGADTKLNHLWGPLVP